MNEVYRTYWPDAPPARTTVISSFVLPGALVEMTMIAVPNGGERVVGHPKTKTRRRGRPCSRAGG